MERWAVPMVAPPTSPNKATHEGRGQTAVQYVLPTQPEAICSKRHSLILPVVFYSAGLMCLPAQCLGPGQTLSWCCSADPYKEGRATPPAWHLVKNRLIPQLADQNSLPGPPEPTLGGTHIRCLSSSDMSQLNLHPPPVLMCTETVEAYVSDTSFFLFLLQH
ncbi:hypothetical protein MHYP_G00339400 [Metynnis hypsauchen]